MIGTIIVFALIPIVALIVNAIEDANTSISFDDVYGESGLPIVSLTNNRKRFNFLIDTGANLSLLNVSHLEDFKYIEIPGEGTVMGMEGNKQTVNYVMVKLNHGKNSFLTNFQVVNLDAAFGNIQDEYGILVHGVLGTEFLESNKGRINFIEHKLKYEKTKAKEDKATLEGQSE